MKLKILRRSNTEQKIRQATNDDVTKNPVMTDLVELSLLTYKPKSLKLIISVLMERLAYVKCAEHTHQHSTRPEGEEPKLRRRLLLKEKVKGYSSKKVVRPKHRHGLCTHLPHLVNINKSLLVVLYLMETGSSQFLNWTQLCLHEWSIPTVYLHRLISPADNGTITIPHKRNTVENFQHIIANKLIQIEELCSNETLLAEFRLNQHKLRSDMTRPGVKSVRVRNRTFAEDGDLEAEVIEVSMNFKKQHIQSKEPSPSDSHNSSKHGSSSYSGATPRARASLDSTRLEVVLELDEELFFDEITSDRSVSHVYAY